MPIDCSNVSTNATYDCANPWGQGCTSDKHFHFASLWEYTENIQRACPNDTRLFVPHGGIASPQNASLTQAACAAIAGPDWTYYPAADIWTRLTTWKFPLLQLVATFPRPPLNFWVECFVILHLLGDPVDTIKNLLAKFSSCQITAGAWRAECDDLLEKSPGEDQDCDWKALAILSDAYGEWSADGEATEALQKGFYENPSYKKRLASAIRETGRALAADRSTTFLPVIVAQAFFIGAVAIAVFRTATAAGEDASSDTVFINVEAHSIAFSALYFWIIPAVFLGSIIGVSQTEAAIPRILRGFEGDVERLNLPNKIELPNHFLDDKEKRVFHGGIYSWQPQKYHPSHTLLSYVIVILGTATGMAVSAFVPPDGWDCRHYGEILILIAWILSAQIDIGLSRRWPLNEGNRNKLFWSTGFKDLLVVIGTMGGIIVVQVGVYNKCGCYALSGKAGLALPEMPETAQTLFRRLKTFYPTITFTCIGIELIIVPLFISILNLDALRTFVQRDDGKSNAKWLWTFLSRCEALKAALQEALPRKKFGLFKGNRTNTVVAEEGPTADSPELHHLTQIATVGSEGVAIENGLSAGAPTGGGQSEHSDSTSQSDGVDWPSRARTSMSPRPDPPRVNTTQLNNQATLSGNS